MPSEFSHEECKRAVEITREFRTYRGQDAVERSARIGLNVTAPDAREKIARALASTAGCMNIDERWEDWVADADAILALLTGEPGC